MNMTRPSSMAHPVEVKRWSSERPLYAALLVVSILLWLSIIVGTFGLGLIYVGIIGLFIMFVHIGFIAYLRGSAVRIGPDQFPELYTRVVELSQRAGLKYSPETYILQAGGSLNALATRLFRGRMIVLFSDLLEACDGDEAARDMIIGHEIGHLRSGHLDWMWLIAPGRFIPFLGSAYSRACELTCDRWGAALCNSKEGAKRGLLILAAGGPLSKNVNANAFVRQQEHLNYGWMTLAKWLSAYPPLAKRVQEIAPDPMQLPISNSRGNWRASGILLLFLLLPAALAATVPFAMHAYNIAMPDMTPTSDSVFSGDADDVETARYGSVADMPVALPVPEIDDSEQAALATQCFAGDMGKCDALFYASPGGSVAEEYGNSCGGRIDDNNLECVDLIAE